MRKNVAPLIDTVTAEREVFISETHKPAMATLTKGDELSPATDNINNHSDNASTLTDKTSKSKAKSYTEAAKTEVSLQYVGIIQQMTSAHDQQVMDLEARLLAALGKLCSDNKAMGSMDEDSEIVEVVKVRAATEAADYD